MALADLLLLENTPSADGLGTSAYDDEGEADNEEEDTEADEDDEGEEGHSCNVPLDRQWQQRQHEQHQRYLEWQQQQWQQHQHQQRQQLLEQQRQHERWQQKRAQCLEQDQEPEAHLQVRHSSGHAVDCGYLGVGRLDSLERPLVG